MKLRFLVTLALTFLVTACAVERLPEERSFNLSRLHGISDDEGGAGVRDCIQKIIERDFEGVYEYGSAKFKKIVTKEGFTKKNSESPQIEEMWIDYLSTTVGSGFYLSIRYTEPGYQSLGRHTLFFWKFEDAGARFIHFPFGDFPDTLSLHPIYENN